MFKLLITSCTLTLLSFCGQPFGVDEQYVCRPQQPISFTSREKCEEAGDRIIQGRVAFYECLKTGSIVDDYS